jgi:hypothetical protein
MELLSFSHPFPHVIAAGVLSSKAEASALSILRTLQWQERTNGFYRVNVAASAEQLANLSELPALAAMIQEMKPLLEAQLQINLGNDATMVAQLYDGNSIIGFHTDHAEGGVRLVLNLNENWQISDGGIWVLANRAAADQALFLPPLSNTAFAFQTSARSFHALTRRSVGNSYALIVHYPAA